MFKRILVPVDGSDTANKALVAASQMARDSGGRVRLVHVAENPSYVSGYDMYGGCSGERSGVMRESGARILDDAMAIAQAAGIEADNLLCDQIGERLGEVVADAAVLWNVDLIVVGAHGQRGVDRVVLGSGAEQIIRLAPVPVLVIHSTDVASRKPSSLHSSTTQGVPRERQNSFPQKYPGSPGA